MVGKVQAQVQVDARDRAVADLCQTVKIRKCI